MARRQIVIDTETTGLKPRDGHRIIEIGCVEIIDRMVTENNFHQYINPEREVEKDALQVHGISNEFLKDKPVFADVIDAFLEYIRGAELIAHNAPFDMNFIRHEIKLLPRKLSFNPATVIDTLQLSRKLQPGQRHNLDVLCKRYKVDNTNRTLHGALLDATLLAEVYLRMTGGQATLFDKFFDGGVDSSTGKNHDEFVSELNFAPDVSAGKRVQHEPLSVIAATAAENAAHEKYLNEIKQQSGKCVWLDEP